MRDEQSLDEHVLSRHYLILKEAVDIHDDSEIGQVITSTAGGRFVYI